MGKKKEVIDSRLLNDSSDDDDGGRKSLMDKNMERLKEKYKETDEKRHKEHKHKDHKHKKEKKHKKDKHRDKEGREDKHKDKNGRDDPLSTMLKEMTPDSSSSEPIKPKVVGSSWSGDNGDREDGYTSTLAPAQRVAHVPNPTTYSYQPPKEQVNYEPSSTLGMDESPADEQPHQEASQDPDEESDDELGDLPVPVFA